MEANAAQGVEIGATKRKALMPRRFREETEGSAGDIARPKKRVSCSLQVRSRSASGGCGRRDGVVSEEEEASREREPDQDDVTSGSTNSAGPAVRKERSLEAHRGSGSSTTRSIQGRGNGITRGYLDGQWDRSFHIGMVIGCRVSILETGRKRRAGCSGGEKERKDKRRRQAHQQGGKKKPIQQIQGCRKRIQAHRDQSWQSLQRRHLWKGVDLLSTYWS
ncbi:uncharacterized protein LOC121393206 isoform X4 [Xenopus laevis]|uniref:Uncharacterized protein LOC121393206 isoform X4 n=1 Tax=Xenopus laevis TaxID=8355 RepID=A0A8J1KI49_XENLA|nr:uncharacterized protein LOC121393206 isoform X4 [Xenopus laevis]